MKAVSSLPCSMTVEKFCHWGDVGSWMLMELASGRVLSAFTKTRKMGAKTTTATPLARRLPTPPRARLPNRITSTRPAAGHGS